MKTSIVISSLAALLFLSGCADSGNRGSSSSSMPGMTAEEHAKMKH